MVPRILLVGLVAVLGAPSIRAQTPAPGAISAEATEALRAAPDIARLTFQVLTKDPVAETATDENEKLTKDLLAVIAKLKLAGVKVTAQSLKIGKVEAEAAPAMPNNNPAPKTDFRAARAVTITLKEADAERLQAGVANIQKEAAKIGIAGETGTNIYNPLGADRQNSVRVSYGLQAGWDDRSKEVLAKLTKRALERAALMAEGAGLKVVEVTAIEEPREVPQSASSVLSSIYGTAEQADDLTEGELVLKVRVRVTVRVAAK